MAQLQFNEPRKTAANVSYSEDEFRAMQCTIIKLFKYWSISDRQAAILLGGIAPRTFQRWKIGEYGRLRPDLAARLSNLLGIHKALRLLFKKPSRVYGWIKRPNATFSGYSALDVMLNGQLTDLMRVRRYLDAQVGTG